jgi:hypothetical protein
VTEVHRVLRVVPLHAPFHQMVLENTLMELMKNIWSNTSEDVGVREIGPEGMMDGSETFVVE